MVLTRTREHILPRSSRQEQLSAVGGDVPPMIADAGPAEARRRHCPPPKIDVPSFGAAWVGRSEALGYRTGTGPDRRPFRGVETGPDTEPAETGPRTELDRTEPNRTEPHRFRAEDQTGNRASSSKSGNRDWTRYRMVTS